MWQDELLHEYTGKWASADEAASLRIQRWLDQHKHHGLKVGIDDVRGALRSMKRTDVNDHY
eukprot:2349430-Alexandrium_andersonii.AAC.1